MQQLPPRELRAWLDDAARAKPFLLDVREPWEFETCRIDGSQLIPMREMQTRWDELDPQAPVVVICHHGVRSFHVARLLERQGFTRVYNLSSGVDGWAREVDLSMPIY